MTTDSDSNLPPRLAIVAALPDELVALLALMATPRRERVAGREFWLGRLAGVPVVAVLALVGKVAAAVTATLLVERYRAPALLFVGVAGGLGKGVAVGDVVVADALLQHDMDAAPLFPPFEVPLTGTSRFAADAALTQRLARAAARALCAPEVLAARRALGLAARPAQVHRGLIASGDRFIASATAARALRRRVPDALAVEMEGAAVAQVGAAFGVPFALARTISDRADDSAHVGFTAFLHAVAAPAGAALVRAFLDGF